MQEWPHIGPRLPITSGKPMRHLWGHVDVLQHAEGPCQWQGTVASLVTHVRDDNRIQVCQSVSDMTFGSFICNFHSAQLPCGSSQASTTPTVFAQKKTIKWAPIWFLSMEAMPFLLYMTLHRTPGGLWVAIFRTAGPRFMTEHIRIQAEFHSSEEGGNTTTTFSYVGRVAHHFDSNSEAIGMGRAATAMDATILGMTQEDHKVLFQYRVRFLTY